MSWTCPCNTQNLDSTRYCEFCGREHAPAKANVIQGPWSPPTPAYAGEPWEGRRALALAEVEPYLAELRKIAAEGKRDPHSGHVGPTAEQVARYLGNLRKRGISTDVYEQLEAQPPHEPTPVPSKPKPMTPGRMALRRRLARMFPVTEAEERAALKAATEDARA